MPLAIHSIWQILLPWLLAVGIFDFILMGLDKGRAMQGEWRISEKTLFIVALLGGWWGMLAGMGVFHHKSRKLPFIGFALIITALWIYILEQLIVRYGPPFVIH
jgi:uncharacterized membrane protein YsdA (DUF1294 family)